MTAQLRLLDGITVHCFACPQVVVGESPVDAHDRMEDHYARHHDALIRRLAGILEIANVADG